jgi:hypothetical protein
VTFLPDLRFKRCTLQNLECTSVGDLVTLVCKSHLTTVLVILAEFFETPLPRWLEVTVAVFVVAAD